MFDDFETQIQIDEIIPEEYEDWLESIRKEEHDEWFRQFCEDIAEERFEEGLYAEVFNG